MAVVSMKQLLESGVHFGHQTRRWNPKMKKYIYAERNDIHIIDLQQTVAQAEVAYTFVRDIAASGKPILFVGTKKQAQEAIKAEAERCGMYYINNRWLGGTLTNYKTIKSRIERLNKINQMEKLGELDLLPKKEVAKLLEERNKLEANLGVHVVTVEQTQPGDGLNLKNMTNFPEKTLGFDGVVGHLLHINALDAHREFLLNQSEFQIRNAEFGIRNLVTGSMPLLCIRQFGERNPKPHSQFRISHSEFRIHSVSAAMPR